MNKAPDPEVMIGFYGFCLMVLFAVLAPPVILIREWLKRHGERRHRWSYRNPANRTCRKCGRHEQQYIGMGQLSPVETWELMFPMPHTPEACDGNEDTQP